MIGKPFFSPAPLLIGKHYTRNRNFEGVVYEMLAFTAVSDQTSNNEFLLNDVHASWSNGSDPSYKPLVNATATYNLSFVAHNNTNTFLVSWLTWGMDC